MEQRQFKSNKLPRDLVSLGKKYARIAFPNPNREGCPSRSALRAMASRNPQPTLQHLPISHVATCSPCFMEYTRLRRRFAIVHGIQVAGVSLAVFAILFGAMEIIWRFSRPTGEPSISRAHQTEKEPAVTSKDAPSIAPYVMTINLASFSPTRGEEAKEPAKMIHLPSKLLRITLLLPIGMEPGEYVLQVENEAGAVLNEMRATGVLDRGVTSITADFDLRTESRGRLTLMVRPPGLSGRTFPVLLEGTR